VLFRVLGSCFVSSNDNKELENSTLVQDAIKPVWSLIYAQPFGFSKGIGLVRREFLVRKSYVERAGILFFPDWIDQAKNAERSVNFAD